jgi:hypothetical protein
MKRKDLVLPIGSTLDTLELMMLEDWVKKEIENSKDPGRKLSLTIIYQKLKYQRAAHQKIIQEEINCLNRKCRKLFVPAKVSVVREKEATK